MPIRIKVEEDFFGCIVRITRPDRGFVEVQSPDRDDALQLALEAHREARRARHAALRRLRSKLN